MELTTADLMPRVERGAAWLTSREPHWQNRIDVQRLVMDLCGQCVLGQCFGGYYDVMDMLWPGDSGHSWGPGHAWAIEHGFTLHPDEDDHDVSCHRQRNWVLLRNCWVTVIQRAQQDARAIETPAPELVSA